MEKGVRTAPLVGHVHAAADGATTRATSAAPAAAMTRSVVVVVLDVDNCTSPD
jgi:hypothetical protein